MNVKRKKPKLKKKVLKHRKIPQLTPFERAAKDVLKNARRPLSTKEVADFGNMSWSTAKKHLKGLHRKRKTVHTQKKGKTRLWFIK